MLFKYESDNLNLIKVNIFHEKGKCRHLAIFRREADYSVLMVLTVGEAVKGWLEKISIISTRRIKIQNESFFYYLKDVKAFLKEKNKPEFELY